MAAKDRIIPGFNLSLGYTVMYLSFLVLLPLSILAFRALTMDPAFLWQSISSERVIASYKISFLTAFFAALVNGFFGLIAAWVLVRYNFPGKRIVDSLIDLPFALPTAVAGISLTTVYAPQGWLGKPLASLGITVAFTPLGIFLALLFVGLPFVVRTLQPIIEDLEKETEEAAAVIGASRSRIFFSIIFPALIPGLLTGFSLAFARAIGEYGSVVFISGNMPMKTEITPLLIMTKLEQYDYNGAIALGFVMLVTSFVLLLIINHFQNKIQTKGKLK